MLLVVVTEWTFPIGPTKKKLFQSIHVVIIRTKKRKKVSKKDSKDSKEVSCRRCFFTKEEDYQKPWKKEKQMSQKYCKVREPREGSKTPGPTGRRASANEVHHNRSCHHFCSTTLQRSTASRKCFPSTISLLSFDDIIGKILS